MRKPVSLLAVTLSVLLLLVGSALPQGQQSGAIAGIVKDTSGALVKGATIDVTSTATGVQRSTVTGDDGAFNFSLLPVGKYTVKITAPGFSSASSQVTVQLNETERINPALKVGSATEQVVVEANATLVNTESAVTGQPIDAHTLQSLPLAVPNFLFLLSLSAGTSGELPDPRNASRGTVDINVNGQRTSNNSMALEGINVNDFNLAHFDTVPLPNPNAIEEFKVATSLYDASAGSKGGGAVGLVFRSGSKNWHGEMYGNYRNDALNANDWFFNHTNTKKPKLEQSVFGASGSGPVPFVKGFFFANYQGIRAKNGFDPNGSSTTVLSPVFPTAADGTTSAALLAPAFALTPAQIDPTALNILNLKNSYYGGTFLIPRVGQTGCTGTTTLTCKVSLVAPIQGDQYSVVYDRPFRDGKDKIGGRWFFDNFNVNKPLGTASSLAFPDLNVQNNRFATLSETHQISDRQLNEFRFGFSRFLSSFVPTDKIALSEIGAQRPNQSTVPGIYRVSVTNLFSFGTGVNDDRGTVSNSFYYGDTWSYARGKHSMKAGTENAWYQLNRQNRFAIRGDIGFNNFTNFLKGQIDTIQSGVGDPQRYFRAFDWALFYQDDWRILPSLTLNLGVRYDNLGFAHDRFERSTVFDPSILQRDPTANPFLFPSDISLPGLTGTPGIGSCGLFHCRDQNNISPRVGFAWDMFSNGKTILRGGYGIYFQRTSNQNLLQGSLGPPFFIQVATNNPTGITLANPLPGSPGSGLVATQFIPSPSRFVGVSGNGDPNVATNIPQFSNAAGQLCQNYGGTAVNCTINLASFSSVPTNVRAPYNQQWNLTVQRELFRNWAIEVGYVGAHYVGGLGIYNPFQAAIASPSNPIVVKDVTGKSYSITTNTQNNETLRMLALGIDRRRGARTDGNIGFGIYHSAQVTLSHRFSKGLYFQSAYTYSKSIDNVSGSQSTDELNATQAGQLGANLLNDANFNPALNRARGDFDRPHRLVISYTYLLPVPKSGIWGSQAFQGWNINGITTFQNGLPFSVTDSAGGRMFGGGTSSGVLNNCSLDQANTHGDIHGRIDHYLNLSCFAPSPVAPNSAFIPNSSISPNADPRTNTSVLTLFGNIPRNAFRGPFQQNWDFALGKTTKIFERHTVDFRADFFNIFNHPSFRQPSTVSIPLLDTVGCGPTPPAPACGRASSTFGQITSTVNPARIIQFGLKYSF